MKMAMIVLITIIKGYVMNTITCARTSACCKSVRMRCKQIEGASYRPEWAHYTIQAALPVS